MASEQVATETGCPWWSRDRLKQGLGEARTYRELAERWNTNPGRIREWADRHNLSPFEELPALGRDVALVLEEFAAEERLVTTAVDVREAGEIPENANQVSRYVEKAVWALDGLRLERCGGSGSDILWRLRVEE